MYQCKLFRILNLNSILACVWQFFKSISFFISSYF